MGTNSAMRWLLAASGGVAAAGEATAGAWSQPAGKGHLITTLSREVGDFGEAWRTDDLLEYGMASGWDAVVKLEGGLYVDEAFENRFGMQAGVKRSFAFGERAAVSLQASVLTGDAIIGPDCDGAGFEARTAAGTSFQLAGMDGFVNVEGAWRSRGEQCERSLAELAVGLDLAPKWRTIAKIWSERGDGSESAKADAMVMYDFETYSVGLGYRREISGAFEEDGVVAALWTRF